MEKDIFRTAEEEAKQVVAEMHELKELLREVAGKIGRIESRMKRAFPDAFLPFQKNKSSSAYGSRELASFSAADALKVYDELVNEYRAENRETVRSRLSGINTPNLLVMGHELGATLGRKKPSRKTLTEAILGRISESVMLSKHVNRETEDEPQKMDIPKSD